MSNKTKLGVADETLNLYGLDKETLEEQMRARAKNTLLESLGMEYVEITPDKVVMNMTVGPKTCQYFGILHGGASVALAETAATTGTAASIDIEKYIAVGMEINANHIKGKRDGIVTAVAIPLHKGRTSMVWDIKISDEDSKLICVARCTVAVVSRS
jgi:1,4-dihydroxy-2-naphthoyl-CoA hydrolase